MKEAELKGLKPMARKTALPAVFATRLFSVKKTLFGLLAAVTVCATILFSTSASAEWVEWIADAETGIKAHKNLNRSSFADDEREDTEYFLGLSFGRYNQLADSTRLRLTVDLDSGLFGEFEQLDYRKAGFSLSIRQKLAFGRNAAWVKPNMYAAYLDVDDDARESILYGAGVQMGKRLTERLDGRVGYIYEARDGKDGDAIPGLASDVFDQESWTVSIEASYALTERVLLTGGYAYRSGEFDSSCTPTNFVEALERADISAMVVDDAYSENFCAYKVFGAINTFSIDASYSLFKGHGSVGLGYEMNEGEADDLSYSSSAVRALFMYSY
ncbi:MAG: hypothetical protein HY955_00970 [Deltaproteobacteria bacterium]|nr:hypothetical protein [Deltaproteobacteria bacterium]